jgi:cobalt-zinc-cadmium efflux system outer membrane protein
VLLAPLLVGCASATDRDTDPFDASHGLSVESPASPGDEGSRDGFVERGRIAQGLTLAEAEEVALRANASVLAMSDAVNAAKARIAEASVFTNPVLTIDKAEVPISRAGVDSQGNVIQNLTNDTFADARGRPVRPHAFDLAAAATQFSLSKDFDVSGKRVARVDSALENERQAEAQFASAALQLRALVHVAYAAVLVGDRNFELAKEARDMARRNLAIIVGREEGGNALRADALRAKADADRAEIDVKQAERDQARLRRALTTLLGDPEATLGSLRNELPLGSFPEDAEESKLVQEALARNADVIAARRAVLAAEANLRLQKRSVVPDVTVSATYNRYFLDKFDSLAFGLSVPLPIFDRNGGPIAEATALLREAEHQVTSMEKSVIQGIQDDVQALRVSRARIAQFEASIVPGYRDAVSLTTTSYEGGKVLYVDVIAARTAFNQTRSDYVNELLVYETTFADLERLLARTGPTRP